MNRAVFLDRDGVITQEPPYYAHRPDQLTVIPRAGDAIRLLNEHGFRVVIVSNQSGIGRGYYREEDAESFNRALGEELTKCCAHIDAIYMCPHYPEGAIEKYRIVCDCRKPEPGLLLRARNDLKIDVSRSFMIGDKLSDIEAGKRAGCQTILVRTGQGEEQLKSNSIECSYVAVDLYDASEYILRQTDGIRGEG